MSTNHCLTDCLRCHTDSGNIDLKQDNKKQWLTLTKNSQKNNNQSTSVQRSNYKPFIKLIKVPCAKVSQIMKTTKTDKSNSQSNRRSSRKSTSPNQNIDFVQLVKGKAVKLSFSSTSNQYKLKSYSLGQTQKPIPNVRPINFIYQSEIRQCSKSEKKNQIVIEGKKVDQTKIVKQNSISPIKQEAQQRQNRSSLFQGAKSIVSRLVTSRKNTHGQIVSVNPKTAEKDIKIDVKRFYDNARLCETQNAITYTNQSILAQDQEKKHSPNQNSFDQIPMSPQTIPYDAFNQFKVGRLLGVGKWAHVYLCQDKRTSSIYAIKQIFKQSIQAKSFEMINKSIDRLINLNHNKLMKIYSKFETKEKLCLLVQYCGKTIYEQLKEKGLFPLQKIQKCSRDLIQVLVFLHQNQFAHGNINIFQIFANFDECKLKPSYRYLKQEKSYQNLLRSDIQGLAIVIFEMGHGLIPFLHPIATLYQKEKQYQQTETRKTIINFIKSKIFLPEKDPIYILLNDLIKTLLSWCQNWRLMASQCINHKFFLLSEKC